MRHFEGGGCSLGEAHAGPCVWSVTNTPEAPDPVTNTPGATNSDSDRILRWRAANKDKYNAYQREYMRRRRA